MKVILFDLDGTIVDSQEGITKSVQYALGTEGVEEPDRTELLGFIGPPLLDSFKRYYGFTGEKADRLVVAYRQRYEKIGWREAELYPGIKELLQKLRKDGYQLGIASSKPEVFCKKMLEHFGVSEELTYITGADLEGKRGTKAEVLQKALERFKVAKEEVILVGDTRFDALGAKEVGVSCIGVTYGFGTREELEMAGAVQVVDTVKELEERFA